MKLHRPRKWIEFRFISFFLFCCRDFLLTSAAVVRMLQVMAGGGSSTHSVCVVRMTRIRGGSHDALSGDDIGRDELSAQVVE
jgi:hypothetical protein